MKKIIVKELANQFDLDLEANLQVHKLPDDSLVYRNFLVKQLQSGDWGVFNIEHQYMADSYHLKCSALIAARSYQHRHLNRCSEVKELDRRYWGCYGNVLIYKNNIINAKDDKYQVLLTRLNETTNNLSIFKKQITQLFKTTFT